MEILIVGQFGIESMGIHIKEALENMGHKVICCVPFRNESNNMLKKYTFVNSIFRAIGTNMLYSTKEVRRFALKRVLSAISSHKADLIICTHDYFLPEEINKIKKDTGARIVMWYPDHIMAFGRAFFMTAGYDALFFKDPYIVKNLRDIYSMNAYYLPEAFSRTKHAPVQYNNEDEKKYKCQIAMIGNLHSFRVPLMQCLNKYDLKIYGIGNPWWLNIEDLKKNYTGEFLAYQEKAKAIKYSEISLNTLYFGEIEGVNVRTFEIAGAGGFQISQYKSGIASLFDINNEIVTYKTIGELYEKIDYYLSNEKERKKIATAGLKRAWRDHYYEKRLTRLINMTFKESVNKEDYLSYTNLK